MIRGCNHAAPFSTGGMLDSDRTTSRSISSSGARYRSASIRDRLIKSSTMRSIRRLV